MAERRDIATAIRQKFGCDLINQRQAGEFLGMSKKKTKEFLAGVEVYLTGKEHKYFASDIARHMDSFKSYEKYGTC